MSLGLATAQADEYGEVSQLLREGKLADAQSRIQRHLARHPRDPQMRLYKGVIQRESGRHAEAIITFSRLSEDFPNLPEPYNNLAVIYASQGQYDKARVTLEKALRTNPSYATAHNNLGDIYTLLASQAYSKALQSENAPPPQPPRLALIRDLHAPSAAPGQPVLAAAPPVAARPAPPATVAPPAAPPAPKPAAVIAAAPKPAASPPPTVTAPAPVPAKPTSSAPPDSSAEVERAVQDWAKAWSDRNMPRYLAAYSKDFDTPGRMSRSDWEEQRRVRIVGKARIEVSLTELQVTVKGSRAVAKFRQDYKADTLAVVSLKTLELVKTGDRWLIVRETSGG